MSPCVWKGHVLGGVRRSDCLRMQRWRWAIGATEKSGRNSQKQIWKGHAFVEMGSFLQFSLCWIVTCHPFFPFFEVQMLPPPPMAPMVPQPMSKAAPGKFWRDYNCVSVVIWQNLVNDDLSNMSRCPDSQSQLFVPWTLQTGESGNIVKHRVFKCRWCLYYRYSLHLLFLFFYCLFLSFR